MKQLSKLEKLMERQRDLESQIKAAQKLLIVRRRADEMKRFVEIGGLAKEAGLLQLSNNVLREAFHTIGAELVTCSPDFGDSPNQDPGPRPDPLK